VWRGDKGDPLGRLPQLVNEAEAHLQRTSEPSDSTGWLQEIAHLELLLEDIQWNVDLHAWRVQRDRQECKAAKQAKKGELSAMGGDLRLVRQQLSFCEKEYARLVQFMSEASPELQRQQLAELRVVEEEIEAERRRQKQLVSDNQQRDVCLMRNVIDGHTIDANARALHEIERLEAELRVWEIKNAPLVKQVEQAEQRRVQASESCAVLGQKERHVAEMLDSEDQRTRLAEKRKQEAQLQSEEEALREELECLREERHRLTIRHERKTRERAYELSELKEERQQLEARRAQLDFMSRQAKRQLRPQ